MLGEVERAGGESEESVDETEMGERQCMYRKTWVDNQDFHAKMKQEEA